MFVFLNSLFVFMLILVGLVVWVISVLLVDIFCVNGFFLMVVLVVDLSCLKFFVSWFEVVLFFIIMVWIKVVLFLEICCLSVMGGILL